MQTNNNNSLLKFELKKKKGNIHIYKFYKTMYPTFLFNLINFIFQMIRRKSLKLNDKV